jgi:hypothetical protein
MGLRTLNFVIRLLLDYLAFGPLRKKGAQRFAGLHEFLKNALEKPNEFIRVILAKFPEYFLNTRFHLLHLSAGPHPSVLSDGNNNPAAIVMIYFAGDESLFLQAAQNGSNPGGTGSHILLKIRGVEHIISAGKETQKERLAGGIARHPFQNT